MFSDVATEWNWRTNLCIVAVKVILIHQKLLFRFRHTEERGFEGLENICCVRGKCGNFDVIFTQKSGCLRSDMGTAVIDEQHSFRLGII
jgi:hypothetical protein